MSGAEGDATRLALLAGVSEREFQRTVVETARALGWRVFFTYRSTHSPEGEPDLRLVRPPRVVFAELKTAMGRLTPAQETALAALRGCPGVEAYVWRPTQLAELTRILSEQPSEPQEGTP